MSADLQSTAWSASYSRGRPAADPAAGRPQAAATLSCARARIVLDPALQDCLHRPEITPEQLGGPDPATVSTFTLARSGRPRCAIAAVGRPSRRPRCSRAAAAATSEAAAIATGDRAGNHSPPDLAASLPEGEPAYQRSQQGPQPGDEPKLMIDWPKRRREPEHLKFVRTQPCLLCGRTPSDAHHLRFAQSRGIRPQGERRVHRAAVPRPP